MAPTAAAPSRCTAEGTECSPIRVTNCEKLIAQNDYIELVADNACMTQCAEHLNAAAVSTKAGG